MNRDYRLIIKNHDNILSDDCYTSVMECLLVIGNILHESNILNALDNIQFEKTYYIITDKYYTKKFKISNDIPNIIFEVFKKSKGDLDTKAIYEYAKKVKELYERDTN